MRGRISPGRERIKVADRKSRDATGRDGTPLESGLLFPLPFNVAPEPVVVGAIKYSTHFLSPARGKGSPRPRLSHSRAAICAAADSAETWRRDRRWRADRVRSGKRVRAFVVSHWTEPRKNAQRESPQIPGYFDEPARSVREIHIRVTLKMGVQLINPLRLQSRTHARQYTCREASRPQRVNIPLLNRDT